MADNNSRTPLHAADAVNYDRVAALLRRPEIIEDAMNKDQYPLNALPCKGPLNHAN